LKDFGVLSDFCDLSFDAFGALADFSFQALCVFRDLSFGVFGDLSLGALGAFTDDLSLLTFFDFSSERFFLLFAGTASAEVLFRL